MFPTFSTSSHFKNHVVIRKILIYSSILFAGATLAFSPTLSTYLSLSKNISKFVTFKRVHNVGEMESYDRLKPVFLHWVWASGFRKGLKLDMNHAKAFLWCKHFDKTKLERIFKPGPSPMHSESVEIQNMLGDIKVSEYGSFVDGSWCILNIIKMFTVYFIVDTHSTSQTPTNSTSQTPTSRQASSSPLVNVSKSHAGIVQAYHFCHFLFLAYIILIANISYQGWSFGILLFKDVLSYILLKIAHWNFLRA